LQTNFLNLAVFNNYEVTGPTNSGGQNSKRSTEPGDALHGQIGPLNGFVTF
jgi:hypothetical protein